MGWTAEDVLEDCGAERGKKVFIAIGLRLRKILFSFAIVSQ